MLYSGRQRSSSSTKKRIVFCFATSFIESRTASKAFFKEIRLSNANVEISCSLICSSKLLSISIGFMPIVFFNMLPIQLTADSFRASKIPLVVAAEVQSAASIIEDIIGITGSE